MDLDDSLKSHFGFGRFRLGQEEAVKSLLEGRHTLVVMPTGSGKSLIFQLAGLQMEGLTLVLSPLIALMKDQVDRLTRLGIPATYINSMLDSSELDSRLNGMSQGKFRLVYIAPERLRSIPFVNHLGRQKVALLAVDEAHCISNWGHDFRPDYLHISQFRKAIGNPLTAALTATATPHVQDDIVRLLGILEANRIFTGFNRPNLTFEVRYITSLADKLKILQSLLDKKSNGSTIIYTGTRHDAEEAAEFIQKVVSVPCEYYHAGLSSMDRTRIQDEFMSGKVSMVAATNAFGMGIDRADVRQVIHYSLPGSLEAYYQEAGRAGRDGEPARAILMYAPADRALQEWFIESNTVSFADLRIIYEVLEAVPHGRAIITLEELSRKTGMHEVKVKVGLAGLERAEGITHSGDEGTRIIFHVKDWNELEITKVISSLHDYQSQRRIQLKKMIAYSESNLCRRRIILNHFGDRDVTEADACCDNCLAKRSELSTQGNRTNKENHSVPSEQDRIALIILDTISQEKRSVGRQKFALILIGSKAVEITRYHYDKNKNYQKLSNYSQRSIEGFIDQLIDKQYLKVIGGKYPVLQITPKGESALYNVQAIPLKMLQWNEKTPQKIKHQIESDSTVDVTYQLLREGLNINEIAKKRNLTVGTIYDHFSQLIAAGRIKIDSVVSHELLEMIISAIGQVGSIDRMKPIMEFLPENTDYGVIRCAFEHIKREQNNQKKDQGDGGGHSPTNTIEAFLSGQHPRQLKGSWDAGWALDFHSRFYGSNWNRSEIGELVYRYKYQQDMFVLPTLIDISASFLNDHPDLVRVDAVVPVPPSSSRPDDPVSLFAAGLAKHFGLEFQMLLTKSRQTSPQKEMHTLAQKRANVAGAFQLNSPILGKKVLIVDDLFDSGATLEEATQLLHRSGASKIYVLTLTRTIHTDA